MLEIDDRRYIAVGELIQAPGKVFRVAPLQYDYGDLKGACQLSKSVDRIREHTADLLLPSKGVPIAEADDALGRLYENVEALQEVSAPQVWPYVSPRNLTLEEFSPNAFFVRGSGASTHFVQGKSGKVKSRFSREVASGKAEDLLEAMTVLAEKVRVEF